METEKEFVDRQAAEARTAMKRVWSEMKHTALATGDVRRWTARYPWLSTGSAVAAGVAAGYFLTPRNRDEATEMWENLKRHFEREKDNAADGNGDKTAAASEKREPSIWHTLATEAIRGILPAVTAIVSGIMSEPTKPDPDPQASSPPPPAA
jgi:hypothetical protein